MKAIFGFSAVICGIALGQGSMTPPGGPAPTMKSLQEIWDKSVALEAQNLSQQQQIATLLQKNNEQNAAIGILLEKSGVPLPWNLSVTVPVGTGGGDSSLAFQSNGKPAISYYEGIGQDLKYAVFDGTAWQSTLVDSVGDVGGINALAFLPDGTPVIAYQDTTHSDLKFAAFDGTVWQLATVDSTGNVGTDLSLKVSPSGQPSISYFDATNEDLKFASLDGTQWNITTVDSAGFVGFSTSLAFVADKPAITYSGRTLSNGRYTDIKYAERGSTGWVVSTVETVDGIGVDVAHPSLAVTLAGKRFIAYEKWYSSGEIWVASKTSDVFSNWVITRIPLNVLVASDLGYHPSLAISPAGQPVMSITMDPRNWIMAFPHLDFVSFDGTAWTHTIVDDSPTVGYNSSLAFSPSGEPAISYFDKANGTLKFAVRAPYIPR